MRLDPRCQASSTGTGMGACSGTLGAWVALCTRTRTIALALITFFACSCSSERQSGSSSNSIDPKSEILGSFAGGTVTREDLSREANKLPPILREQFGNNAGKKELVRSIIDKRLLVEEARRRKIQDTLEIRRQVADLEERLIVQSLLASEEKSIAGASEKDLRAFYETHKGEFEQPEHTRIARILVLSSSNDPPSKINRARARIEKLAQRLGAGEPISKLCLEGDGPERERGGEIDLSEAAAPSTAALLTDTAFVSAAAALKNNGAISPVFACRDGFAVLQLIDRHAARVQSFEEVRSVVQARMTPIQKRQVFDNLLVRLRRTGNVRIDIADH